MTTSGLKALGTAALVAAVFIPGQVFAVAGPGSLKKQAEAMEAAERAKAKEAAEAASPGKDSATAPASATPGTPDTTPAAAAPATPPAAAAPVTPAPAATPAPASPGPSASPAASPAAAPASRNYDPALASQGRKLYQGFCQKCHGLNMVTTAAGFFDLRQLRMDEKPRFIQSVTNGLRAMPAWGSVIKPEELEQLWSFVMTTNNK